MNNKGDYKVFVFAVSLFLIIIISALLMYYFGVKILGEFGGLAVFIIILALFKIYEILKNKFHK